ncbi:sulfite exporter TauE/SafE family protein [Streptomyces uncialis]|uniref:urease accessory protein UreH domain-containing protein n=1 Tax=Streptomyces uncialis TaxID=1048205 RepID=UPI0037F8BE5F
MTHLGEPVIRTDPVDRARVCAALGPPLGRRFHRFARTGHNRHPGPAGRHAGRAGLIGMGIADGLVPSPSALVALLGAVALGRTAFGVLPVLAYGLGMAGTLTLAGLLLLHVKHRLEASPTRTAARRLRAITTRVGPVCTAGPVVLVGAGLTLRALTG